MGCLLPEPVSSDTPHASRLTRTLAHREELRKLYNYDEYMELRRRHGAEGVFKHVEDKVLPWRASSWHVSVRSPCLASQVSFFDPNMEDQGPISCWRLVRAAQNRVAVRVRT